MKTEKIEELFDKHSCKYKVDSSSNDTRLVPIEEFISAINQIEFEIYREVIDNLRQVNMQSDVKEYIREIQNKIKELENEN